MANVEYKLQFEPTLNPDKLNVILRALKQSLGELGKNIKLLDPEQIKRELNQVDQAIEQVAVQSEQTGKVLNNAFKGGDFLGAAFRINQITQLMAGLTQGIGDTTKPFVDFESGLAELSAITGVTGNDLELFGDKARELAKAFGGDAIQQLDAFKGVLSRLGPDLAKSPAAMEQMTIAINTLAKAGGLDAAQSMDALTTVMLQFGISLDDPMKAAQEATRIINILAAGAKEGAAEIPQISEALTVTGVQAKAFNMSIEETNASLQALATGGKYGAEAGTALRNVLGKMAGEEVIPKDAATKLKQLGVDMKVVSDKTIPFADRLRELSKAAGDATAFAQVFGTENAAAATILANSADKVADFTLKLTGTNVAFDQAAINMDTIAGKTDRFKAAINDFLIGVGQTLGTAVTTASQAATQIMPLALTLGQMRAVLPTDAFKGFATNMISKFIPAAVSANEATGAMNVSFKTLAKTILTHPLFLGLAGVAASIAAIKAISDALHTTAKEREEEIDAEQKSIELKKQVNQADQARLRNNISLLDQYKELSQKENKSAADKEKLNKITIQLNKELPGTVSHTKDLGANLTGVSDASKSAAEELSKLEEEFKKLDELGKKAALKRLANARDIAKENIEDYVVTIQNKLKATDSGFTLFWKAVNIGSEFLSGTSTVREGAEKFVQKYANMIYKATNEADLSQVQIALSEAIFTPKADKKQANELFELFNSFIESQRKYLAGLNPVEIPAVVTNKPGASPTGDKTDKENAKNEAAKAEEDKQKKIADIQAKYAEMMRIAYLDYIESQYAEGEAKEKFQAERQYREKLLNMKKQFDDDINTAGLSAEQKLKIEENYNATVQDTTQTHNSRLADITQKYIDQIQSDYEKSEEEKTKKLEDEQKKREEIERKQLEFLNGLQPSMDKVFAKLSKALLKFSTDSEGNITDLKLNFEDLGSVIEENGALIATSMASAIGSSVGSAKIGLKDFVNIALDTLNALVPVFAAEILGQQLATLGFGGLLTAAGLMTALYAAVAVAKSAVQSLATGGRIDEPTLAVIGDASRARPGSNTEWVLRDDQIKAIVDDSIFKAYSVIAGTSKEDLQVQVLKSFSQDVNRLVDAVANLKPLFAESEFNAKNVTEYLKTYSNYNKLKTDYYSNRISPDYYDQLRRPLEIRLRSFAEGGTITRPELIIAGDSPRGPEHILDSPALKEVIIAANQMTSPVVLDRLEAIENAILNMNIKVGDEVIYNSYNKTDTRRRSRYRT